MSDTIPKLFKDICSQKPQRTMLLSKDETGVFQSWTAGQVYQSVKELGAGLISLQLADGSHIGLVSDNRKEWLMASLATMCIGAADVPRGSDSTAEEIGYILHHADCTAAFVENEQQLEKLFSIKATLPLLKTIILMDESYTLQVSKREGFLVYPFKEVMSLGRKYLETQPHIFEEKLANVKPSTLATIIYTSGTTGEPKGVMLSHNNFMHQVTHIYGHLDVTERDCLLSVLPVWHSFERTSEYIVLFIGGSIAYSKPIGKILIEDLAKVNPTVFPSVPRIWTQIRSAVLKKVKEGGPVKEALFNFFITVGSRHARFRTMFRGLLPQMRKRNRLADLLLSLPPLLVLTPLKGLGNILVFKAIREKLGHRFRFGISGAGALPPFVDDFFAAAGILLLEGYGLTETAPIISVRKSHAPVPGTIGLPLPQIEVRIVDETGQTVPPGQKGVLYVRGPNVMQGYYKRPEATAKVLSPDGWLNTGDLVMATHQGELIFVGRAKETIVLQGGENVEPGPLEDALLQSEYIENCMVVGQDQRYLAALVVPKAEGVKTYYQLVKKTDVSHLSLTDLVKEPEVHDLIVKDINERINHKKGFKIFERINKILLISQPFEVSRELTHSLKLRRDVIYTQYKHEIEKLFLK